MWLMLLRTFLLFYNLVYYIFMMLSPNVIIVAKAHSWYMVLSSTLSVLSKTQIAFNSPDLHNTTVSCHTSDASIYLKDKSTFFSTENNCQVLMCTFRLCLVTFVLFIHAKKCLHNALMEMMWKKVHSLCPVQNYFQFFWS